MKRHYPNRDIDVCLIATSEINLGIRLLSSVLKAKGYRVVLGFFDRWGAYTDGELKSIRDWVEETAPRIIGLSTTEFRRDKVPQLTAALAAAKRTFVAGGVDATLNPEAYLPPADFVVRGEGEEAFAELVEALLKGRETKDIRNLCYVKDGQIIKNPLRPVVADLDTLPWEDWLDVEHHFELRDGAVRRKENCIERSEYFLASYSRGVHIHTMRGCALSCSYCASPQLKRIAPGGACVRKRSIAPVVDRIAHLKRSEPSIDIVYFFEDDFFLRTTEEIREFAAAWKEKVNLPFFAFGTPLSLEETKLRLLLDAGLYIVNMGIQSGCEKTNYGIYERKISNEKVIAAVRLLTGHVGSGAFGLLPATHDIIINNPYESREDLLETIRFLDKLPKPYDMSMPSLQFYQGTGIYAKAARDGLVTGKDETTNYCYNDVPRHFGILVRRGGDYYLNSLLFWMAGRHTRLRYGAVPAALVPFLTRDGVMRFFDKRPWLITFFNTVIPARRKARTILYTARNGLLRLFAPGERTVRERS